MHTGETILDVRGISLSFKGVNALSDLSFSVARGAISALIGPNGAGKSTTFNLITGVLTSSGGTISVLGKNVENAPPQDVTKLGIAQTFQHVKLVPDIVAGGGASGGTLVDVLLANVIRDNTQRGAVKT